MKRRGVTATLALLALALAAGCGSGSDRVEGQSGAAGSRGGAPAGTTGAVPAGGVAVVNGAVIGEEQFALALRDAAFAAKAATLAGRRDVLNRLVEQELVRLEAVARGADREPVLQRTLDRLRRLDVLGQLTRQISGQVSALDAAAVDKAVGPLPQVMTATVLLVEDADLAADVARRIRQGEDVAALAAQHRESLGSEGVRTREFVTRPESTMYPREVEARLFAMRQGEVAAIPTPVGHLVARVDSKRDLSAEQVANARATVSQRLLEEDLRQIQTKILEEARAKYPVQRHVARFADQPVVRKDNLAAWRTFQETPFATVGPLTLMLDELYRGYDDYELMARSSEQSQRTAFEELANQAISAALYYLTARDRGLRPSAGVEQRIAQDLPRMMIDRLSTDLLLGVRREGLGPEQCRGLFEQSPERFLPEPRLNLRQILVRRENQAQAVTARLRAREDFAKVARELSLDAGAAGGGDLGWRTEKELVKEFGDEGAKDLMQRAANGTAGLLTLRTTKGYHVLSLGGYRRAGEGGYEDAAEAVLDACLFDKRRQLLTKLTEELRAKAVITIDEAKLASVEPAKGTPADGVHRGGGSRTPGAAPHGGMGGSPHGGGGMPGRNP